jgi:hypothetical protein
MLLLAKPPSSQPDMYNAQEQQTTQNTKRETNKTTNNTRIPDEWCRRALQERDIPQPGHRLKRHAAAAAAGHSNLVAAGCPELINESNNDHKDSEQNGTHTPNMEAG